MIIFFATFFVFFGCAETKRMDESVRWEEELLNRKLTQWRRSVFCIDWHRYKDDALYRSICHRLLRRFLAALVFFPR